MKYLGEVGVDQHEQGPAVGEFVWYWSIYPHGQIHVDGEGDVLEHYKKVSDGKSCEDSVRRRDHLSSRQDSDVQTVSDGTEDADEKGSVAMDTSVTVLKLDETWTAVKVVSVTGRHCH